MNRIYLCLAALVVALAACHAHGDSLCELPNVDRSSTSSNYCLGCHDGSVHSGGTVNTGTSHKVGMNYSFYWSRRGYKPVFTNSNLVFPSGLVECTTCHDASGKGTTKELHWLSTPPAQLCFACHDL